LGGASEVSQMALAAASEQLVMCRVLGRTSGEPIYRGVAAAVRQSEQITMIKIVFDAWVLFVAIMWLAG
jgi:hypothetical protein